MNCCVNCFNDIELIGFIYDNSNEQGNCNFCNSKDTQVIDCRELQELFQPIVTLFKTEVDLGIVVSQNKLMHEKIQEQWKIFKLPDAIIKTLLANIVADVIPANDVILNTPVVIEILFDTSLAGDLHEKKWENFAEEIKFKNRFFLSETIDLDLLLSLLKKFSRSYNKGKIFYRARVSDKALTPEIATDCF